jgi:hypothetical protein
MRDLDFVGLADEARAAFRPNYSDVERRARHRRLNVRVGAAAVTVATLAAGGLAINGVAGSGPAPGPTPTPVPSYTQRGKPALPGVTYVRISPDGWDVAQPDKPLTGMFTSLRAGDMNHLYIEYQDCRDSACVRMLAASADGGRTWRKHRMPFNLPDGRFTSVLAVHGTSVIAVRAVDLDTREYFASLDGGMTWRSVTPVTVGALPTGWPLMGGPRTDVIMAFDPTTGAIATMPLATVPFTTGASIGRQVTLSGPAPEAGIWLIRSEYRQPTPRPTTPFTIKPDWLLLVSHDGGATWQRRTLPDGIVARSPHSASVRPYSLATLDGLTLVTTEEQEGGYRLWISRDGGVTWGAGASVVADGPLRSILVTREGPILLEAGYSAYRSTDGGATLQRVGPAIGAGAHAIPGGYAAATGDDNHGIWLSLDGGTWTYVAPPPLP